MIKDSVLPMQGGMDLIPGWGEIDPTCHSALKKKKKAMKGCLVDKGSDFILNPA